MNIIDIITKKKNKGELTYDELNYVIKNYLNEDIKDYQMSSLLMAIVLNGMTEKETINLTKAMVGASKILDLNSLGDNVVDKHSTGGVGDKTTLIISPLVASCGVKVAKMSGRGLGYTGGTIDKLESIPGLKVNQTLDEFLDMVNKIGFSITSQTEDVALADKKIYALRDVTGTVESLPLIASSIMSKKIALGVKKLVLDIKVGTGALIHNIESARKLAHLMIKIGKSYNIKVVCLLTNMDVPLGQNIGNTLEVEEAIDILKNHKTSNLTTLCLNLATEMVALGLEIPTIEAGRLVQTNFESGRAYIKFLEYIKYQKADIENFPISNYTFDVLANKAGYLTHLNARELGKLSMHLGSGRLNKEDQIDYTAGIEVLKRPNDPIHQNDTILRLHTGKEHVDIEGNIFQITPNKEPDYKLIYEIIKED